jgi:hypothetical protein
MHIAEVARDVSVGTAEYQQPQLLDHARSVRMFGRFSAPLIPVVTPQHIGKITKVLNMKPAEILGMIEEASGTRMFEERKEKAVKTMAKKDKKVEEIASVRDSTV